MRSMQLTGARVRRGMWKGTVACKVASPKAASRTSSSSPGRVSDVEWASNNLPSVPEHVMERNKALAARTKDELILAPLTRGTHVPFRQLCNSFGCNVTMSEMAIARQLKKRNRKEITKLRMFEEEPCFGLQIATNNIAEGVNAARMAHDAGAAFIDLNCGCPIYEITRRGCGAILLRKPRKLARLVAGIVEGSPIPVTVKVRTGENAKKINVLELVPLLEAAGAAAVTIHGRTMEQRYKRPADWDIINAAAESVSMPVIGNGDLLTRFEVEHRKQSGHLHGLMTGRGALVKPWIFEEVKLGQELEPTAAERVGVYRRLVGYMKDYFHDDALGRKRAFYFLPWHFEFFCRYRRYPAGAYESLRRDDAPLMSFREGPVNEQIGESVESLSELERLLRCTSADAHSRISEVLWDAASDADAVSGLNKVARDNLKLWEATTDGLKDDNRLEAVASG